MKYISCLAVLVSVATSVAYAEPQNIPISQLEKEYQIIGKLHWPLGKYITVEGVVVDGPSKGYEGGPNIRAQRIHGRATQEDIQIVLHPYFGDWGEKIYKPERSLPKLETGKTYRLEGYESGGYIGAPSEAYEKSGLVIQIGPFYFRSEFVVVKAERVEPIPFGPGDFVGQKALVQGTAATRGNQATLIGKDWTVIVDPKNKWPQQVEGKLVETYGLYNPTSDRSEYTLVDGESRMVQLEDQLGRAVTLRGVARSSNDVWWFHYRGTDLYVENMSSLPGWTPENHWRPMIIRGILEKANLPRLDQISLKRDRDLTEHYIIRKASWQPLPALLSPERTADESE